jgi:hypothetical protein
LILGLGIPLEYRCEQRGSSNVWKPSFRDVSSEKLKLLRDHVSREEQIRWHPDPLEQRNERVVKVEDELINVKNGLRINTTKLQGAVFRAVLELKTHCQDELQVL